MWKVKFKIQKPVKPDLIGIKSVKLYRVYKFTIIANIKKIII